MCVRGGHSLKITFKGWVIKKMKHFTGVGQEKKLLMKTVPFPLTKIMIGPLCKLRTALPDRL